MLTGADPGKARMLERSLGSIVSVVGIGHNACQPVPAGEVDECPDGFGCKAISSCRRHQALPGLRGAVLRLPLEPGAADCPSVCDPGDPVEAEGTLVAAGGRSTQEHGRAGDIALEGEVRCPESSGPGCRSRMRPASTTVTGCRTSRSVHRSVTRRANQTLVGAATPSRTVATPLHRHGPHTPVGVPPPA